MNCPDCGTPVERNAQYCPKCSARIEPPSLWQRFFGLFRTSAKPGRSVVSIKKTVTIKTTEKDGQRHEYHSLAEVPPELRGELEKLESEGLREALRSSSSDRPTSKLTTRKTVSVFRVKDAAGNERVYHSLEELSPEIRAAVDKARQERP